MVIIKVQIKSEKNAELLALTIGCPGLDNQISHPEVVHVINNFGHDLSKQIFEALEPCGQHSSKIKSLLVRLQLHKPLEFEDCFKACVLMVGQYDRMQAFAVTLGNKNVYWQNPEVAKMIENVLTITEDNIREDISQHYAELQTYIAKIYGVIYS